MARYRLVSPEKGTPAAKSIYHIKCLQVALQLAQRTRNKRNIGIARGRLYRAVNQHKRKYGPVFEEDVNPQGASQD